MFHCKYELGLPDHAIAKELNVSIRTIQRKKKSAEFKALEKDLRKELMNRIFVVQHEIIDCIFSLTEDIKKGLPIEERLKALNVLSKFCNFQVSINDE